MSAPICWTSPTSLLDATPTGLVSSQTAEQAIQRAVHVIEGLSENGDCVHRWLSGHGMHLTWAGA